MLATLASVLLLCLVALASGLPAALPRAMRERRAAMSLERAAQRAAAKAAPKQQRSTGIFSVLRRHLASPAIPDFENTLKGVEVGKLRQAARGSR